MKVLQFTQKIMKISTLLPLLNESIMVKVIEVIKLAVFVIPPIYLSITSFAFVIVHIENFSLIAQPAYVAVGSAMSLLMSISFYFQSKQVIDLLENIEVLVNAS